MLVSNATALSDKNSMPVKNQNKAPSGDFKSVLESVQSEKENEQLPEIPDEILLRWRSRGIGEEPIQQFRSIVKEASNEQDIFKFLNSLSADNLAVINKISCFAEDLTKADIAQLSVEGARNLVVIPDNRGFVDLNNDGIVEHGQAKLLVMPPPNAPEEIKIAWEKATEGMSFQEKMLKESIFLSQSLVANIKKESQGSYHINHPGDDDYVNIFPVSVDGWIKLLEEMQYKLEQTKKITADATQVDRIEKDLQFLTTFNNAITAA